MQSLYATAQPGSDPFEFIMKSGTPPKSSKLPLPAPGNSKNGRILVAVVGIVILGIIASIVFAIISSNGDQTLKDLTGLAEQQNELIRVADIGVQKAVGTDAQNLAITTKYSIESDQTQTLTYLAGQHHKVSANELKLLKNTQTDIQLTAAAQNNRFDEAFTQVINNQLINYQNAVKRTYNAASARPNAKKLMATLYNNINVLATQVKGIQQSDQSN